MLTHDGAHPDHDALLDQIAGLRRLVLFLAIGLVASTAWLATRSARLPTVLTAERLDIIEPDGNLAFVMANSQRPVGATIDGQVLQEGQQEERWGLPSLIFFDGKGDEVGGMLMGSRESGDGYSAARHLSLDGYNQDQTVVLAHYQDEDGASAGLTISDRPLNTSILDTFGQLGIEAGATREDVNAVIAAIPEEERNDHLRESFGVERIFLGSGRDRSAALTLRDREGRPRIVLSVDSEGTPVIRILDESGAVVWSPVEGAGS